MFRRSLLILQVVVLLSGCVLPVAVHADDTAGNLKMMADEGLELIDNLPRKGASDIIGYNYYRTLPDGWELLQRAFDVFEFRFADAFTDMNREKYFFSMALLLCAKNQEVGWLNTPAIADVINLKEDSGGLWRLMEVATDKKNPGYSAELAEFAEGLKAVGYTMDTLQAVCDACNQKLLLDSLDWVRLRYLARAWFNNGTGTLKRMGEVLEKLCGYTGDAQSFAAVMSVLKNEGFSALVDAVISQSIKAGVGTAGIVYQVVLAAADGITRLDALTGSFHEMTYAAEALEACEGYLKYIKENFSLNYKAYLEYDEGLYLLNQDYECLMYAGANYAGVCAVMNKTYSAYIDIGKTALNNSVPGVNDLLGYIDDTMISRAEQADQDAKEFLNQADGILEALDRFRYVFTWGALPEEDAEPEGENTDVEVQWNYSEDFAQTVIDICIGNGLEITSRGGNNRPIANRGSESAVTVFRTICEKDNNPLFTVWIDEYQSPVDAADDFRLLRDEQRRMLDLLNSNSVYINSLYIDSKDAIGKYTQSVYGSEKFFLSYYKLHGNCLILLEAADEKDFDQGVRILEQIEAAALQDSCETVSGGIAGETLPGLSSDEFFETVGTICEDFGIGLSFADAYQGMNTGVSRTIYDTFSGGRNPYFSVTIDRYPDPDAAREAFGPILEAERAYNRTAAGITQVIADSPDAIGSYMWIEGLPSSNLRYYRLYGNCLVIVVALEEENFDRGLAILGWINAVANGEEYVYYDLDDYDDIEPVYEAFDREDNPAQTGSYASHAYDVLGHEITCRTNIDDYIFETDGKLVFDYASLAENLGWRWTAWRQEDEAVYGKDGQVFLKGENGEYYAAAKRVYMLDDEFSADARWYVWFWYPNNGIFERIEYAYGTGKSHIDFTRTDLYSQSMEGNRTYYLNTVQDGTVSRDMAVIACYLLENISQESDADPLKTVYGKSGPYQE